MTTSTLSRLSTAPAYPVLPAEDLERARRFYTEMLGLPIENMGDGQFMVTGGFGTKILVYARPRTTAEHTVVTFMVDDLHGVMADLRSRGVVFEEYDLPGLKTVDGLATMGEEIGAWFVDSEGNILNVAQMS